MHYQEQLPTKYRDKDGRVVQFNEKVLTDKEKLEAANIAVLSEFQTGAKQLADKEALKDQLAEARSANFGQERNLSHERELIAKERFGDPLKQIVHT